MRRTMWGLMLLLIADGPLAAADTDVPTVAPPLTIGGAVRFQYVYRDWSEASRDKLGDLEFDVFRLNVSGEQAGISFSAEYRWYEYMDVIHHAWVGYGVGDPWLFRLGVQQVPFGLLPYASNNFLLSANYYIGLEDSYRSGLTANYQSGPWDLTAGLFKNPAWGSATTLDRFSFDAVPDDERFFDEETNQANLRLSYHLLQGEPHRLELGASALYGGLYNRFSGDMGSRTAGAAHVHYGYQRWDLILQASRYHFSPEGPRAEADLIRLGAFAGESLVPRAATSYVAGLAYTLPLRLGPLDEVRFYNDYSTVVAKRGVDGASHLNALGMAITAGGLITYVDLIFARNMPFFGGSLAEDDGWNTRVNVNVGYYF